MEHLPCLVLLVGACTVSAWSALRMRREHRREVARVASLRPWVLA